MPENASEHRSRLNGYGRHIATLVLAVLAGTGGSITFNLMHNAAPDRFTGTQGKTLIAEQEHINRRLVHMEDAHHQHQSDVAEIKLRDVEMSGMLRECQSNMESGISREHGKITELKSKVDIIEREFDHLKDDYTDTEKRYDSLYDKVMSYKKSHPGQLEFLGIEALGPKRQ